jgi:hypothetical protein
MLAGLSKGIGNDEVRTFEVGGVERKKKIEDGEK